MVSPEYLEKSFKTIKKNEKYMENKCQKLKSTRNRLFVRDAEKR